MDYKSTAEPRSWTGDVPVYCSFDELVDTAAIIGNPRNPNTHPEAQVELLAQIIRSTGWRQSITVSRNSGFVVKGHGRLAAAMLAGIPQCPVEYQEYSNEAEEWADLTADNRLAELAEIDDVKLADLLAELTNADIPLELTGYTEEDLESILDGIAGEDPEESTGLDDDYEQALPPMTKPGDLWIFGGHRLICGDATDEATIKRLMDGKKGHLVHTDPPYGVSYETQSGAFGMIKNDDKTHDELYASLLLPVFKLYRQHTIKDAAFYVWHASSTRRDFEDALTAAGLMENQYLIWVKNGLALGHADYQWSHEPCFYASRAGVKPRFFGDRAQRTVWRATTNEEGRAATTLGNGLVLTDGAGGTLYIADRPPKGKRMRYVRVAPGQDLAIIPEDQGNTVWEVARETGTLHPTQKPVELPRRAIENSTQPGEIVLDFFGGSGSTMLAAEMTGRRCFSTELDPVYCDVAISRYVMQTHDCGAVCVRNGKELRYTDLVRKWAKENGMTETVKQMRYPVVVIKKIVPASQQDDTQGGE